MVESHLVLNCRIERYEYGLDSLGGRSVLSTEVISSVCFLTRVTRTGADMVAAAEQGRVYYQLQLPHDVDIQDQDAVFLLHDNGEEEQFETVQVLRQQGVDVMRQATLVKAGS